MDKRNQTCNIQSILIFSTEIPNDLFKAAQKILDDKTLAENLYLLEPSDNEQDQPTETTKATAQKRRKRTPRPSSSSSSSSSSSDSSDSDSSSSSSSESESEDESKPQHIKTTKTTPPEQDEVIFVKEVSPKPRPTSTGINEPEAVTFHISCYISMDTKTPRDYFTYQHITSCTLNGNTVSHLDYTHYDNVIRQAKRTILLTTPLRPMQQRGVRAQLHSPAIFYATPNGDKTRVPLPFNPVDKAKLPEPKYYITYGDKHNMVSIYLKLTLNFDEMLRSSLEVYTPTTTQKSNLPSYTPTPIQNLGKRRTTTTTATTDDVRTEPERKRQRPEQQQGDSLTRTTQGSSKQTNPAVTRWKVTKHRKNSVFDRLGPKAPIKDLTRKAQRNEKSKKRRQHKRKLAALTTNKTVVTIAASSLNLRQKDYIKGPGYINRTEDERQRQ